MTPEVSRVLARAKHRLLMGGSLATELLDQYGSAETVGHLPAWIREAGGAAGPKGSRSLERDESHASEHLRKFNPAEPRNPHSGKWIDTTPGDAVAHAIGKVVGRMSEDDFFGAHGGDDAWHDQYGGYDLHAILWKDGTASLYRDAGKGRVQVFADIDAPGARRLADTIEWAARRPDTRPADFTPDEPRHVRVGPISTTVGYDYDNEGDLFVHVTFPPAGNVKKPTTVTMDDLDGADATVVDLRALADDIESGALRNS